MNNNTEYNRFFKNRELNKHSREKHGVSFFSHYQELYNQMNIVIINRVAWMIKKQIEKRNPVLSEILKYIAERRAMIDFIQNYLKRNEENNFIRINFDYIKLVKDGNVTEWPRVNISHTRNNEEVVYIIKLVQDKINKDIDPIITDLFDLYLYVCCLSKYMENKFRSNLNIDFSLNSKSEFGKVK